MSAQTVESILNTEIPLQRARPVQRPSTRLRSTTPTQATMRTAVKALRRHLDRDAKVDATTGRRFDGMADRLVSTGSLSTLATAQKAVVAPVLAELQPELLRIADALAVGDHETLHYADAAVERIVADHLGPDDVTANKRTLVETAAETLKVPTLDVPGRFAAFGKQVASLDAYVGSVVRDDLVAQARSSAQTL